MILNLNLHQTNFDIKFKLIKSNNKIIDNIGLIKSNDNEFPSCTIFRICRLFGVLVNISDHRNVGPEMYYRSGTVNSKSFVGKVLLQIKWKFELNYAL